MIVTHTSHVITNIIKENRFSVKKKKRSFFCVIVYQYSISHNVIRALRIHFMVLMYNNIHNSNPKMMLL